ncbi:hypothetical protein [Allokutzneria oryzae]|uniref:DUF3558 domain-containing protein n=1 Tax=Allokutzneria oryzae TaxID=1378989 RepID=A0ABV5ZV89_9PSEU
MRADQLLSRRHRATAALAMVALLLAGCARTTESQAPPPPPGTESGTVPPLTFTKPTTSTSESDVAPPTTTSGTPLVTGVVEDECLLTTAEFSALVGQPVSPGTNTQLDMGPEGQKRSCFYPTESSGLPKNWINIYGTTGQQPSELVQRANKNSPGSTLLPDIGLGAVTVPAPQGSAGGDMYIATSRYLLEIHVGDGTPDEPRWVAAGRAAFAKAPA